MLTKLSKALDKDSVRVDGVGPASITEVSFQEINITGNYFLICIKFAFSFSKSA